MIFQPLTHFLGLPQTISNIHNPSRPPSSNQDEKRVKTQTFWLSSTQTTNEWLRRAPTFEIESHWQPNIVPSLPNKMGYSSPALTSFDTYTTQPPPKPLDMHCNDRTTLQSPTPSNDHSQGWPRQSILFANANDSQQNLSYH